MSNELPAVVTWVSLPAIAVPDATPARLSSDATIICERGLLIQAPPDNAAGEYVEIFSSGLNGSGILLAPDRAIFLPVRTPYDVWCLGSVAGLGLRVMRL